MTNDDDDAPGPPWRPLIGLLVVVVLGIGVWFVIQQLRQSASLQDCIASGRTNCAPINVR
ncbi:MAG: hypothetical protein ACJ8AI_03530 [Rhodopila sp.]